jgi:hypothetical protein
VAGIHGKGERPQFIVTVIVAAAMVAVVAIAIGVGVGAPAGIHLSAGAAVGGDVAVCGRAPSNVTPEC